ncbi:MAG: fibronectin type III domain-containing protein, partial [Oleiphilaceae bacterium]|nr:fibronectin type III domain-containing protein [Oleiphilaceae bacterium]
FTLNMCADEPVTGFITVDDAPYALSELSLCHTLVVTGRTPNTAYTVVAEVSDAQGNGPAISQPLLVTTLPAPDLAPPVIELIPMVIDISATHATVIWTTDEYATSGVSYNDGTQYHVVSDPAFVKEHVMPLADLTPETTYSLTVSSTDRFGNGPSISQPISFTTLALADNEEPLIIGAPLIQNITHQSVVVRWHTSEPAATRLVIGTDPNALQQVESRNGLRTSHNLPVTGLQPDTVYYFQVQTTDAEGNLAMSDILSFRTKVRGHQGNPHFMSAVEILKVTDSRVTVFWTTDVNADARLVCVSDAGTLEVSNAKRTKKHTLTLSGLQADTTYTCTAYSTDHHGYTASQAIDEEVVTAENVAQLGTSSIGIQSITPNSAEADTTAPVLTASPVLTGFGEIATLALESDEPAVAKVEYRLTGSTHWQTVGTQAPALSHLMLLHGLSASSDYEVRLVLADSEGNLSSVQTLNFNSGSLTDIPVPGFVSQPRVSAVTSDSALVSWSTSDLSFGQISYGTQRTALQSKEANIDAVQNHQVTLTRLDPATIYYVQVSAINLLGETVNSDIVSFTTPALNNTADSDGDGLPDAWEIDNGLDPQNANDAFEDWDNDGLSNLEEYTAQSDLNDADSDDDGMPDGWEVDHGHNPNNAADATQDADNDGVSNLNEYLSATDTVPPVISLSSEITLNANGPLTAVPTSNISAVDNVDGSVAVVNTGASHVPPGRHLIHWLAEDAAGNRTIATQTLNVNPQVQLGRLQTASEDGSVSVRVRLSGTAPLYPVQITFTITGSVDEADYRVSRSSNITEQSTDLTGTLVFEQGTEATLILDIEDDQVAEGDEFLFVTLSNPVNAVLGDNLRQQVTITERNVAPQVRLHAEQNGLPVTSVSAAYGPVTIQASVVDVNTADSHSYDWSATDNQLADSDSAPDTLTFDPANVASGVYTVSVSVTDDGLPSATTTVTHHLRIVDSLPALSASEDSDGDGTSDASEGHGDTDGDGVADYLDPIDGASWLSLQTGSSVSNDQRYLMQAESGTALALGTLAMQSSDGGARISAATLSNSALYQQHGADAEFANVGGYFDFEVRDIMPVGNSVRLVIPLSDPIPADARYRKLHPTFGWQDFTLDANNHLYSAAGEPGVCPSPGDAAYQLGLTQGHYCVMMRIEDGGANDADGEANGTIVDPGGIASPAPSPTSTPAASGGGGGGCAVNSNARFDPVLLLMLLIAGGHILRKRKGTKQEGEHSLAA